MDYITEFQIIICLTNSKIKLKTNKNIKSNKAIEAYKKLIKNEDTSEEYKQTLEKKIKVIEEREIIAQDPIREPKEIPISKDKKIVTGPPIMTRFEKARIIGARSLQLSLGAPPFIKIPANARTSLDISMLELDQKKLPIIIKRTLPNGDYQNIPLDCFE